MKKIFAFAFIFLALFSVACDNKPKKELVSISIDSSFYAQTIYVGDTIDFNSFTFTATYNTGETEAIDYSVLSISNFSSLEEGSFFFKITYKQKEYSLPYTIIEPQVISCRYIGNSITLYKNETPNFSSFSFLALYSNGEERSISLNNATSNITDDSLTNIARNISFTYMNINFEVPCSFTYRPIQEGTEYTFIDSLDLYLDSEIKITITNNSATLYTPDRSEILTNLPLTTLDFNRYKTRIIKGGKFVDVELHLVNSNIYMSELEE